VADSGRRDIRLLVVLVGVALVVLLGLAILGVSVLGEVGAAFDDGIGLKTAAIWGFGLTVALMVLFAVVAGDGLFGEIQYMLGAFFTFFAVITLLVAWVF
jgi:hypothetical protein